MSQHFVGVVAATLAAFFAAHHGGASHGWTVTVTPATTTQKEHQS